MLDITHVSPLIRKTAAVLAILLGLLSVGARAASGVSARGVTNDFTQDYVAARAWTEGRDPYASTADLVRRYLGSDAANFDIAPEWQRSPHPPTLIVLVRAVSWMPYRAARITWLLLTALCTAFALGWFARLVGASKRAAVVIGIGSISIPVIQTDLVYAQSTGILLLLFVLTWWNLRKNRDLAAGIALGSAVALKLFPVFMLLPLVRLRRFRATTSTIASGAVLGGIGVLLIGVHESWVFLRRVSPENFRIWRSAPINLSLLSVPYRWLTQNIWRPYGVGLSWLATLIVASLVLLLVVLALRNRAPITGDVFWETVPLMLLAIPIVWETYLVLVVPLSFLVIAQLIKKRPLPFPWLVLPSVALVSIGLIPGLPPIMRTPAIAQILGFSLPMYGLMGLAAVGAMKLRASQGDAPVGTLTTAYC